MTEGYRCDGSLRVSQVFRSTRLGNATFAWNDMKELLVCLCLLNALGALAAPASIAESVDREITKLAALHSDGLGYHNAKMRHVVFGPLFGAERKAAVAFFSLAEADPSNVHFEYLAIFALGQGRDMSARGGPKERPLHLIVTAMVGGRGIRTG